MPTPKYIDSPHSVQTSLYGYDRNKKIQVNNLRGKPIVVLRSDTVNARNEHRSFFGGGSRFTKKWIDRSNQMPPPIPSKPMYPSYTHFHHQYSCPKQPPAPLSLPSSPKNLNDGPPFSFNHTAHDRSRRLPPSPISRCGPNSPKLTPEDEVTVKRLFDKLEVLTSPTTCSSNSSFSNVSSEITLLELNPKIATKTFGASSVCASTSELGTSSISSSPTMEESSFQVDTPKSLSNSRRTSCSSDSSRVETRVVDDDEALLFRSNDETPKQTRHSCPDEAQCIIFRNGICVDEAMERKVMLQWYDDLIQWRHDIITRKRFGPPQCHPPPLTITMIGASRAQRANSFQRVGEIHPFAMEAMDHVRRKMDAKRSHRLVPAELPLPPPHEFMINAKCMEPHLFIEYCYQLTAAAYQDTGLTPPHRRPPIPPRIEPMPEQTCRESVCSSASELSSDGEYSDDSDDTKQERLRQKMERHRKRENRLQKIFRRRQVLDEIDEEDDD